MSSEETIPVLDRYPGIRPFERNENGLFFGRKAEIKELLHLLKVHDTFVLFSNSGLGKSSLINAGLVPRLLEENFFPVEIRFQETGITLDDHIKQTLRSYLEKSGAVTLPEYSTIKDDLVLLSETSGRKRIILIFDQYEEFFSHHEAERARIANLFFELNQDRSTLNVKLFFSIRADRISFLDEFKPYLPNILQNCFQLLPLPVEKARQAIIMPAQLGNRSTEVFRTEKYTYSDEAIQVLLDTLGRGQNTIESSQLQIVCQELERIANEIIRTEHRNIIESKDFGGREGITEIQNKFYEKQIDLLRQDKELNFSEEDILTIKKLIEDELLTGNKRVSQAEGKVFEYLENIKANIDKPTPEEKYRFIIEKLLKLRLIREEQTHLGKVYEISHDTLVDAILKSRTEREESENNIAEALKNKEGHYQYLKEGNNVTAKAMLQNAIAVFDRFENNRKDSVECRILLARILESEQSRNEAEALLNATFEFAQTRNDQVLIGAAFEGLGAFYQNEQEEALAQLSYSFYLKALEIYRQTQNYPLIAQLAEHLGGYKEHLYNQQINDDNITITNEIDEIILEACKHYQEAVDSFKLINEQIGLVRAQRSLYRTWGFIIPWGYLTEVFTGKTSDLKGKKIVEIGRDVIDPETKKYLLKNTIGFDRYYRGMSRRHMKIHPDLTVEDTQSLNGTTVNTLPLYYGNPRKLTDGDTIVLANIMPLQFNLKQPDATDIPADCWAIMIDGQTRKIYPLVRKDIIYSIAINAYTNERKETAYRLSFFEGDNERALMRLQFTEDGPGFNVQEKMEVATGANDAGENMLVWKIRTTLKDPDSRTYKDYILTSSENWFPMYGFPMLPQLSNFGEADATVIHASGPTFQLIINPAINPELKRMNEQG